MIQNDDRMQKKSFNYRSKTEQARMDGGKQQQAEPLGSLKVVFTYCLVLPGTKFQDQGGSGNLTGQWAFPTST